ncbi:hypothetical protein Scep_021195 [Stephania cephalantha]|uniref:Legume lectin domain-containing protein n=1 Tax=Stephania cephalantha TaxID=152367 RepID=A0AAP0F463_9MAGN
MAIASYRWQKREMTLQNREGNDVWLNDASTTHSPLSPSLLCLSLSLSLLSVPTHSLDFLFNSFKPTDLTLVGDATTEPTTSTIRLTNDSNQNSFGRAFHPSPISLNRPFSTSFVFSILPQLPSNPGFGLAFVLSNTTDPPTPSPASSSASSPTPPPPPPTPPRRRIRHRPEHRIQRPRRKPRRYRSQQPRICFLTFCWLFLFECHFCSH